MTPVPVIPQPGSLPPDKLFQIPECDSGGVSSAIPASCPLQSPVLQRSSPLEAPDVEGSVVSLSSGSDNENRLSHRSHKQILPLRLLPARNQVLNLTPTSLLTCRFPRPRTLRHTVPSLKRLPLVWDYLYPNLRHNLKTPSMMSYNERCRHQCHFP